MKEIRVQSSEPGGSEDFLLCVVKGVAIYKQRLTVDACYFHSFSVVPTSEVNAARQRRAAFKAVQIPCIALRELR